MEEKRQGAWIQTYSGVQFWPMDPRAEEVMLEDIAHSLAMLCRFNGHCRHFYSVAEHSVYVSRVVAAEVALWGLLHDAAEAYIADVPRPIKKLLPLLNEAENNLLKVIAVRFGLTSGGIPKAIKKADALLLATEKLALMGQEPAAWEALPLPLDPLMIQCWSPVEAEKRFLARYRELKEGVNG